MTQLSFIAIIASILTYAIWLLSNGILWGIATKDTPAWKRTLWKIFSWFNLDEAPLWRRFLLKLLLSILVVTALCCGFLDTYSINPENKTVLRIVLNILTTLASVFVVAAICFTIHHPADVLSHDYFNLRKKTQSPESQTIKIIAINSGIFILWIAVFIGGICLKPDEPLQTFAWLSLSAVIATILCGLLAVCSVIVFILSTMLYYIIIYPIWRYIKWLIE